jgi:hypothetical protein
VALALPRLREIDGSIAPQDLFQQIYVEALVRNGQWVEAQHLLQQQVRGASVRLQRHVEGVAQSLRIF